VQKEADMKKLQIFALAIIIAINGIEFIQSSAVTPTTNPPVPTVDATKPMLLNYSNRRVTVYFYTAAVTTTGSITNIDESSCMNPNHLGFVIQPGGGLNFSMQGVSGTAKSVRVYYGSNDPITTNINNVSKSAKIVPSADHWSIIELPQ
jgi:hypothetical protein